MWWYDGHGSWGGWLLMALAMLAFWSILLAGIVLIVKSTRSNSAHDTTAHEPDDGLRVLDERFARGEIDVEEYTRRREVLRGH